MTQSDLPNYLTALALVPAVAVTSNANGTSVDLSNIEGVVVIRADIANFTAGSTPLLNLLLKESTDNSNWTLSTTPAFTANANAAAVQTLAYDTRAHGRYVRVDTNVSGANASCPLSIVGYGIRQYNPT